MIILSVQRKPSFRLATVLSIAHCVAAGLLWPLILPMSTKAVIAILSIISLIYYSKQEALLSARSAVVAFELSDDMQCILTTRAGESVVCTILSSTFVAPYMTVLNLKPVGKFLTRGVVILPDGIDAEVFRRLRVLLRWKWREKY